MDHLELFIGCNILNFLLISFLGIFVIFNDTFTKDILNYFKSIVLFSLLLLCLQVSSYLLNSQFWTYLLRIFVHAIYSTIYLLSGKLAFEKYVKSRFLYYAPLAHIIIADVVCFFTYKYTDFFNYYTSILFILTILTYSTLFLIGNYRNNKLNKTSDFFVCCMIVILNFTAIFFEYIYNFHFAITFAIAFSDVFYYMFRLTLFFKYDGLTKLKNRDCFYGQVFRLSLWKSSLVSIDLDNLKEINDEKGHLAGNEALLETANTLRLVFNKYANLYRMGGDEFYVYAFGYTIDKTEPLMEAVFKILKDKGIIISYGISYYDKEKDFRSIILESDDNMYKMKSAHRAARAK